MVVDELLTVLKDYVEGRMPHAAWRAWWATHAAEVASRCGRYTFLRLKHRGFDGAAAILAEHGVAFRRSPSVCGRCGEALFVALPGETSAAEIVAFARASRLPGREAVMADGWIHPGRYCPNGCTTETWNFRR